MAERFDAVVIGGGLSGLTAAGLLTHLGLRTLVLERSPEAGGGSQSLRDPQGNVFDKGYHALDCGRSEITTRYFQRLLGPKARRMVLGRGLVLGDSLFPYNAPLEEWPAPLRALFDGPPGEDALGDAPDREALAAVYGRRFADYAFDEILASYPSKVWALAHGGKPSDHVDYIYPWFFPRARRTARRDGETYAYHDRMREERQEILYPAEGGFGAFVEAVAKDVDGALATVLTGVKDARPRFRAGTLQVEAVEAAGKEYVANHYFWCAPLPALLKSFGIGFEAGPLQRLVLGNYAFREELRADFHEILVGSRAHLINRIGFPRLLAGGRNDLLQVEFYFPDGEFPADPAFWEASWSKSLRKLGLFGGEAASFHFHAEIRGVVAAKRYQALSDETAEKFSGAETNLVVPFYNLGPENINRLVPGVLKGVIDALAGSGGKAKP